MRSFLLYVEKKSFGVFNIEFTKRKQAILIFVIFAWKVQWNMVILRNKKYLFCVSSFDLIFFLFWALQRGRRTQQLRPKTNTSHWIQAFFCRLSNTKQTQNGKLVTGAISFCYRTEVVGWRRKNFYTLEAVFFRWKAITEKRIIWLCVLKLVETVGRFMLCANKILILIKF